MLADLLSYLFGEGGPLVIPIVWTEYTATVNGRVLKLVPCEGCATEYVYMLERESSGTEVCLYSVLGEDGEKRLVSGVEDTLHQYLANDFDPIPCPACGHYQRYMFPKLFKTGCLWGVVAPVAVFVAGGVSAISTLLGAIDYLSQPGDQALWRLAGSCAALVVVGLIGTGLWAAQRAKVRNFDPNTEDQQIRIARGRKRAVTKAEFEAGQQLRN